MENISSNSDNNLSQNIQSSTDKRPFHLWLGVILANIGTYLTIMIMEVYDSGASFSNALLAPITTNFLIIIALSLFVSLIPVWLSGTKFKRRNYFGFGIPIILLLPIPYFIWHAYTCTGKFCNLFDMVAVQILVLLAVIFALIYLIGIFFRKWNVKFSLSLVWLESILLIGAIIFLGYYVHLNSSLESLKTSGETESTKSTQLCDSFPASGPQIGDCWMQVIKANPSVDVCSLAEKEYSKQSCLFYMGILYRDTNGCEGDSQLSYNKKDDPIENARLEQCWADKAKIYPGLNICSGLWTLEWNREKCSAFFKTLSQ